METTTVIQNLLQIKGLNEAFAWYGYEELPRQMVLDHSTYHTKTEFNKCSTIYWKYSKDLNTFRTSALNSSKIGYQRDGVNGMNGVGFNLCLTFEKIKNIIYYNRCVLNISTKYKVLTLLTIGYQERHPLQGERVRIFAYKKRCEGHRGSKR